MCNFSSCKEFQPQVLNFFLCLMEIGEWPPFLKCDITKNIAAQKYYHYYGYSDGGTDVLLRPTVGVDYKVNNVPLNFSFDWRPAFVVTNGTDFNTATFGLACRFAFL